MDSKRAGLPVTSAPHRSATWSRIKPLISRRRAPGFLTASAIFSSISGSSSRARAAKTAAYASLCLFCPSPSLPHAASRSPLRPAIVPPAVGTCKHSTPSTPPPACSSPPPWGPTAYLALKLATQPPQQSSAQPGLALAALVLGNGLPLAAAAVLLCLREAAWRRALAAAAADRRTLECAFSDFSGQSEFSDLERAGSAGAGGDGWRGGERRGVGYRALLCACVCVCARAHVLYVGGGGR